MKLVIGMMMLVIASNTFAACEANTAKACKDEAECKAVVGASGKSVNYKDGICSVATEQSGLPDCTAVNGETGAKGSVPGSSSAGKDGTSGTGK